MPTKSWIVLRRAQVSVMRTRSASASSDCSAWSGDQVEDAAAMSSDVGLGVEQGELQVVPAVDLGAGDHGLAGGEERPCGRTGWRRVDLGRAAAVRCGDVAEHQRC